MNKGTQYSEPYHLGRSGLWRKVQLERIKFAGKFITPKDRVLDIGCGDGFLTSRLGHISQNVTGLDVSPSGLRFARERLSNDIDLLLGSAESLPFRKNTFDVVTLFEVIEHVEKEKVGDVLEEIGRVLQEKGKLIITTPNPKNLLNRILRREKVSKKHQKEYSPKNLSNLLNKFGYDLLDLSGIYLPLPGLHIFRGRKYEFIYRHLLKWGSRVPDLAQFVAYYCEKK